MPSQISRAFLNIDTGTEQTLDLQGGRVVKVEINQKQKDVLTVWYEQYDNRSDTDIEEAKFWVLPTNTWTPDSSWTYVTSVVNPWGGAWHIFQELKAVAELQKSNRQAFVAEMGKSIMDPNEVAKMLGLPVPEEISAQTGYPLNLAYNVTVYLGPRSEILFRGRASYQGVLAFLNRFTERGSDEQALAQMMGMLKTDGWVETTNHILDGVQYSMAITKVNQ